MTLATEVGDALPRARLALEGSDPARIRARIRDPGPEFKDILEDATTQALRAIGVVERERDAPLSQEERERMDAAAREAGGFGPGRRRGTVRFDREGVAEDRRDVHAAMIRERPLAAKAAMLAEWRRRDFDTFEAWNASNRAPATGVDRKHDRSTGVGRP